METVKLIIDRKLVEVPKGTTILDAAKGMGIRIPTLCYMKLEEKVAVIWLLPVKRSAWKGWLCKHTAHA